ncbi:MAG: hypothetical protein U5R49_25435 [Deltaproteobacteria bacterium]|nr:hypothetical protein [Deltaproteobacteria bacterium]
MSTSLLYHAFGLRGVKYISTKYERGRIFLHAEADILPGTLPGVQEF